MTVSVDRDAPAGKAGLLIGDVLLDLNGQSVDKLEAIRPLLSESVGKTIPARIMRGGGLLSLDITVGERPTKEAPKWASAAADYSGRQLDSCLDRDRLRHYARRSRGAA